MSTKVNQQQTLFRFVSIRPPQLIEEQDKDHRFVLSPHAGVFVSAVGNRPEGQSKKEAMKIASETFSPTTVKELEGSYKDYMRVATWIARNKQNFSSDELYAELAKLSPLDPSEIELFWDNLYYQIITQKDFYAKESVMQLLILCNMQKVIERYPVQSEQIELLPTLANARVVLSTYLFAEDNNEGVSALKAKGGEDYIFSTKKINMSLEFEIANYEISRSRVAIAELKVLQEDYFKTYEDDYSAALKNYEAALKVAYKNATVVEKERILCPSNCPEIYYIYENLVLPDFNFTPPTEVDPTELKNKLSPESYYLLVTLKVTKERTYDNIISKVNSYIKKNVDIIYSNMPEQPITTTIGNMTFRQANVSSANALLPNSELPFTGYFLYTTVAPSKGFLTLALNIGFPNADVVSANYTFAWTDGTQTSGNTFTDTPNGNMLNLRFEPAGVLMPPTAVNFTFLGTITLSDGTQIEFDFDNVSNGRIVGTGKVVDKSPYVEGEPKAFVPQDFGIRRLGIADYRKVVAEVCCYREAEVAHIENVMQGEFRSKTTTRERTEENTITTENEVEVENLTDTSTSERFEMQSEVANIIAQQKEFGAYAIVKGSYGNALTFEAGTNFATNTAKEESSRQAVTESKEITQRAMERVVNRFRTETIKKITESFKEENSHIFDNRGGEGHVSGVYRYINAIYKNSIYNYGKRLMYEFMIPQPSEMHRLGIKAIKNLPSDIAGPELTEPPKLSSYYISDSSNVDETNYMLLASLYNADVAAPPLATPTIGKSYQDGGPQGSFAKAYNDFKIPEGYRVKQIKYQLSYFRAENSNTVIKLIIGNYTKIVTGQTTGFIYDTINNSPGDKFVFDTIPVSLSGWDVGNYTITLNVTFERTEDSYQNWQMKTYDTIVQAYKDRLQEYYDWLNRDKSQEENVFGTNPLFYRQIEKITLKRNCLAYLVGDEMGQSYYSGESFNTFAVTRNQQMDNYASLSKFMEQAFEWDLMSYNFYPYYWGNKEKWVQLYQSENDDPVFRNFMQAGMARVIVTVRPGFEDAVMHYMATDEIWGGGQMPVIGDPLYMSIVDELKEQEYTIEETWETVLPTSLIGIQKEGVLVNTDGLPCGGGCEDHDNPLIPNTNKLPEPTPPVQQ